MALTTMYEGKNNSPQTDITSAITASDTVIPVTDITVFPAAPNPRTKYAAIAKGTAAQLFLSDSSAQGR